MFYNGILGAISTIISIILIISTYSTKQRIPKALSSLLLLINLLITVTPTIMTNYKAAELFQKENTHVIETIAFVNTLPTNEFTVTDTVRYNYLIHNLPNICASEVYIKNHDLSRSIIDTLTATKSNEYSIYLNLKKKNNNKYNCLRGFEELRDIMPTGKLAEYEKIPK